MHSKSILQIGLTYRFKPFMKLKEQNNLLEFHGLAEVREPISTTLPSPSPLPRKTPAKPKTTDERRNEWWGINTVSLDPWD